MASCVQLGRLPQPLIESVMYCQSGSQLRRLPKLIRTFATADLSALDASKGDRERVVILGSGWAGQQKAIVSCKNMLTGSLRIRPLKEVVTQKISNRCGFSSLILCFYTALELHRGWHS